MKLDMGRRERLQHLADVYSELLTEHQRETLQLHLDKDWSYAEVAQAQGVSRAAVHDLVRRTEAALEEYERKLRLVAAEASQRLERAQLLARIDSLAGELRQIRRSLV
jgi:predicted DNA-binding protein YlxM (UPF0122 family)